MCLSVRPRRPSTQASEPRPWPRSDPGNFPHPRGLCSPSVNLGGRDLEKHTDLLHVNLRYKVTVALGRLHLVCTVLPYSINLRSAAPRLRRKDVSLHKRVCFITSIRCSRRTTRTRSDAAWLALRPPPTETPTWVPSRVACARAVPSSCLEDADLNHSQQGHLPNSPFHKNFTNRHDNDR